MSADQRAAIVTGAGIGIGYAIARQLARSGVRVLLNDIDADLAAQAAQQIASDGGTVIGVGGDVADVATVRGLVSQAVAAFGGLHICMCNAGLTLRGDFFDFGPADFDRVLAVNLRGSFFMAQAAARQMREQGSGGRIVLTSSVTGHRAIAGLTAYGMTKAALEMMARSLVLELAPYNITINAVAPGATVTPRNLRDDPNYAQAWAEVTPLNQAAQPEDIAEAAVFFTQPEARHITGQTLVVDGGWTVYSPTASLDFIDKSADGE